MISEHTSRQRLEWKAFHPTSKRVLHSPERVLHSPNTTLQSTVHKQPRCSQGPSTLFDRGFVRSGDDVLRLVFQQLRPARVSGFPTCLQS